MPDIFVSYARSDRARVATIAAGLVSEGFDVWWDPQISPGETFRSEIESALNAAKCVVVIWSKDSVRRNWVVEEAQDGLDRQVLVPILIDDVVAELPRGFKSVQAADLTRWRGDRDDPNWLNVKSRVNRLTQPSREAEPVAPVPIGPRFDRYTIGMAALLLVAVVSAAFYFATRPGAGLYAARSSVGTTGFRDCDLCPEMIAIPPGSFVMGSAPTEQGRFPNESPVHPVTLAKGIAIGKFEVTWDEWEACVAAASCPSTEDAGWGRGRLPIINVSWTDVQSYLAWLRRVSGKDYRLLAEAEWEYAARAGSIGRYGFGDSETDLCAYANGADQSVRASHSDWLVSGCSDEAEHTAPVGSFKPNQFGLHDMHGNVWEWVQDCFADSYEGAVPDGQAAVKGDCTVRGLRGGAWFSSPSVLRSASRGKATLNTRSYGYGFRVARTLD